VKQRDRVSMTDGEVATFLGERRKVHLATLNPDGSPHLVTMFYGMSAGRIAFWTYRASQKARNLARDPRITCLVEDGEDYFELRGVQVAGRVSLVDDLPGVIEVGKLIAVSMRDVPAGALDEYVAHTARKRSAYLVSPVRVASWDHRKLLT
jgi:PPOX class probable F420-dependent enzyme